MAKNSKRRNQLAFVAEVHEKINRAFSNGKNAKYQWLASELGVPNVSAFVSFELLCRPSETKFIEDPRVASFVETNTYDGQLLNLPFSSGNLLVVGHVVRLDGANKDVTACRLPIVLHIHTSSRERYRAWMAQAWGYYRRLHEHNRQFARYEEATATQLLKHACDVGAVTQLLGDRYNATLLQCIVLKTAKGEKQALSAGDRTDNGYTSSNEDYGANGHVDGSFALEDWSVKGIRDYLAVRAKRLIARYVEESKRGLWR